MKRFFRSGLEKKVRAFLDANKVDYKYEPGPIKWDRRVSSGACRNCSSDEVVQVCKYTPDFVLSNGIWIEAKGRLDGPDRTKHLAIKKQHPEIDIRFVFQRDNPIPGTKNKTRYSEWAQKNGFKFTVSPKGEVPEDWLK